MIRSFTHVAADVRLRKAGWLLVHSGLKPEGWLILCEGKNLVVLCQKILKCIPVVLVHLSGMYAGPCNRPGQGFAHLQNTQLGSWCS